MEMPAWMSEPGRLLHAHAGEERAAGAGVIAGAVRAGRGVDVVQPAEDLELVLHRRQRLHGAVQFEILAFAFGHQVGWMAPLGK